MLDKYTYLCFKEQYNNLKTMRRYAFLLVVSMISLFMAAKNTPSKTSPLAHVDYAAGKMLVPYYEGMESSKARGWDFMLKADTLDFWSLDDAIVDAVLHGNVPDSLRYFRKIVIKTAVVDSIPILNEEHTIEMWVLPDYISVGCNDDFVRMPMSTLAAQRIADSLYCSLPTSYIVDRIDEVAEGRLEIFPFRPLGSRNSNPIVYQDSNNAINALFRAKGYHFGQFVSGLKKDLILSYKLQNSKDCENHIAIYGWHHPDGHAQQPIHVRHANFYADYSHGVRLIYRTIVIDGEKYDLRDILEDSERYRLLSDEKGPLSPATYAGDTRHP